MEIKRDRTVKRERQTEIWREWWKEKATEHDLAWNLINICIYFFWMFFARNFHSFTLVFFYCCMLCFALICFFFSLLLADNLSFPHPFFWHISHIFVSSRFYECIELEKSNKNANFIQFSLSLSLAWKKECWVVASQTTIATTEQNYLAQSWSTFILLKWCRYLINMQINCN